MKLKRVRIYGFKTFADKTEFELDGNIIAVVGPNGCGKSNIVDSILWGLGESNARNLRAQTSQEVIFSGSSGRKSLGYAEVSLLFDNEDGSLPLDSPEVSVTRRLTRAGESTYAINRRNCRLRDVADLLADSGLGRAGYAIVGQSEIDQALAASAGQRRAWIDEAAGVMRYRTRRQDAQRRLEAARGHLERVNDLIRELEHQKGPLEAEAEVARRYKAVAHELRSVEVGLLAKEVLDAESELSVLEARREETQRSLREESSRAEALEQSRVLAEKDKEALDQRIEELRDAAMKAQSALDQAISGIQIAETRLESLNTLEGQLAAEEGAGEQRILQAQKDLDEAREVESAESSALDELKESLASAAGGAKEISAQLDLAEKALSEARALALAAQKREVESAHREDRLQHIALEIKGIQETLPDLVSAAAEAQQQAEGLEAELREAKESLASRQQELKALGSSADQAHLQGRKAASDLAALEGRIRGLQATIESHEGLAQGTRAVLAAADQGMLPGDYKPVGEAIEVDPENALAIETALGGSVNDLIVAHDGMAQDAIRVLKENRLGRATFQPLNLVRPSYPSDELLKLRRERGVVGLASDLVTCSQEHRPVIESLLGRVLVVEDLKSGLALASTRGWSRLVTLEGEVVNSSGAVTGGATKNQGFGMVQRKAELAELELDAADLRKQQEKHQKVLAGFDSERNRLLALIEAAQAVVKDRGQDYEDSRVWMMNLLHEKQSTEKSLARLENEKSGLLAGAAEDGGQTPIDLAALQAERDELMQSLAARQADSQQALQRRQELDLRLNAAQSSVREREKRLRNLVEAEDARKRKTGSLEEDRSRLEGVLAEARLAQTTCEQALADRRQELDLAIGSRRNLVGHLADLAVLIKKCGEASTAFSAVLHQVELNRAKAEGKKATASERLVEEYGILAEEAEAIAGSVEIPADAAALVSRLRRELKGLGDVNLGAIEAYDRLNERHEELVFQVDDIEKGRLEIEGGIRELDRLTRDRFLSTFARLKEEFSAMFQRIFNGGEGSLDLTEGENILDSGVEISVTIPGKKRQRLELLSGGERALSALAFLFALLKVKPSPLVVLDEVDAPLDGRNVERFIAMMRELSGTTQFILITHNPVTIESADVWFGVTMQEPGVSTVVPFKVPQPQAAVSLKG